MIDDQKEPRKVLIAAPSHDGKVNVWHAAALAQTCKIGLTKNINVFPVYMSFDSLVQRARNDIAKLAVDEEFDDLVFIDCDQDWDPLDFFKLLDHDVDIVAAPVVKKADDEKYNVKLLRDYEVLENGLVEVDGVGTGFMRIRKEALKKIYDASEEYKEAGKENTCRMVFEVKVVDGSLYSEDITFCQKWIDMGGKIFIDPTIDCAHSGEKRWVGNFQNWVSNNLPTKR